MAERRALLIGVPRCDDGEFAEIDDVVRADVRSMHRALERSAYSVTTCGVDTGSPEPTGNRIKRAIKQACKDAPADSFLLLYFSGHGVTIDGCDYLVPSDAYRDRGAAGPDPESLVPVVPSDLKDCRARLVVFFVDACRDVPAQPQEPGSHGGTLPYPAGGAFVLVAGCEAGQRCHYGETGSVFTQALAQVLDRRHPARTLSQVLDEVTQEMRRKVARAEDMQQSPDIRHPAMLQAAAMVMVCDGDELTAAWRRAADTTGLWQHCGAGEPPMAGISDAVRLVVDDCARRCSDAQAALRARTGISDLWFDQDYPVRVLERVVLLLDDRVKLSPTEVAMLIAVPFLREVALADLMPEEWTPPQVDLGTLADYTCTVADEKLLSVGLDGFTSGVSSPWVEDDLGPAHVVEASAALGRDVEQILMLCDNLAPLGVTVAGRDRYPADLDSLEAEALCHVLTVSQRLTPLHLVMVAGKVGVSVHNAHRGLGRLERKGLLALPDISSLDDLTPGRRELELIDSHMMRLRRRLWRRYLTPDKPCLTIAAIVSRRRGRQRDVAQARTLIPFTAPTEPVTYAELVDLACDLDCSVGEARKALLKAFPDAEVPAPTPNCDELYPDFEIRSAVVGSRWERPEPVAWRLRPGEIVAGAVAFNQSLGGFLPMLQPYRELGAPVPEPDERTHAALNEVFPDEYDEDMLMVFDEDGEETYISEIDPLRLVQIAGRLGWTPAETHQRMSRLVPIGLRLEYPGDACPDETVRWQDLLLLTRHLDGHEPAVTGRVTTAHVAVAAEETGESTDWILDRLRLYAPLFALTVDRETADA